MEYIHPYKVTEVCLHTLACPRLCDFVQYKGDSNCSTCVCSPAYAGESCEGEQANNVVDCNRTMLVVDPYHCTFMYNV